MTRVPGIGIAGLIFIGLLVSMLYYGKWKTHVTGGGDSWGYYVYLPAAFIYGDLLTLDRVVQHRLENKPGSVRMDQLGRAEVEEAKYRGDRRVIKYTSGIAILNIGAFFMAHLYALLDPNTAADGFTKPYIFALYLNALLAIVLGCVFLFTTLLRLFDRRAAIMTTLAIAFATNVYYFGCYNNVMAHPYLFFLWAFLLHAVHAFYEKPDRKKGLLIGVIIGLIALIRPVEIICVLVFLLWGVHNLLTLRDRIRWFYEQAHWIWIIPAVALCVWIPQTAYWLGTTGQPFFYSYGEEGFNFAEPHIHEGLFDFKNGWLIYSPVMALSLLGIPLLFWRARSHAIWISMVVVTHIYITYSWWNWYYINGFGSRPMIDIYPVLAIPFCACVYALIRQKITARITGALLVFFAGLNGFQVYQQHVGVLWTEYVNKAYYWQSFGKTRIDQKMSVALDTEEYQYTDYQEIRPLWEENFEDTIRRSLAHRTTMTAAQGHYAYEIKNDVMEDLGEIIIRYDTATMDRSKHYIKLEASVYVHDQIADFYRFAIFVVNQRTNEYNLSWKLLRLHNKPRGPNNESRIWWGEPRKWDRLEAYFKLSDKLTQGDIIALSAYVPEGSTSVFVDDLKLVLCER